VCHHRVWASVAGWPQTSSSLGQYWPAGDGSPTLGGHTHTGPAGDSNMEMRCIVNNNIWIFKRMIYGCNIASLYVLVLKMARKAFKTFIWVRSSWKILWAITNTYSELFFTRRVEHYRKNTWKVIPYYILWSYMYILLVLWHELACTSLLKAYDRHWCGIFHY